MKTYIGNITINRHALIFLRAFILKEFISDHALIGHVMETTAVEDEFQCQLNCMRNDSCKSVNLHPVGKNRSRLCELNKETPAADQGG